MHVHAVRRLRPFSRRNGALGRESGEEEREFLESEGAKGSRETD